MLAMLAATACADAGGPARGARGPTRGPRTGGGGGGGGGNPGNGKQHTSNGGGGEQDQGGFGPHCDSLSGYFDLCAGACDFGAWCQVLATFGEHVSRNVISETGQSYASKGSGRNACFDNFLSGDDQVDRMCPDTFPSELYNCLNCADEIAASTEDGTSDAHCGDNDCPCCCCLKKGYSCEAPAGDHQVDDGHGPAPGGNLGPGPASAVGAGVTDVWCANNEGNCCEGPGETPAPVGQFDLDLEDEMDFVIAKRSMLGDDDGACT